MNFFSVIVYTVCAILALGLIIARRFLPVFGSAELGGSKPFKYASSALLVGLWFLYVLLSSLVTYNVISNPFA